MSIRFQRLTAVIALTILASCVSGPTPSSVILARPVPPLIDTPVRFQRMMPADVENSGGALRQRAMPRRLIVTSRELTMPGGNGNALTPWEFTLSFAIVESVEVRTIAYDPLGFMGRTSSVEGAVIITDQRGVCMVACVFLFADNSGAPDLETANRFATIVRSGRTIVDPFGRDEGPRTIAAAFGLRAPRPVWRGNVHDHGRPPGNATKDIENAALRYAESELRSDFRQGLTAALNAERRQSGGKAWTYEPITDLKVNRKTELDTAAVARSPQLRQLGSNSLLVSDVYGLGFTYIPAAAGEPARIETAFRAFVDFYDLEPVKDGRYFWFDFNVQRTYAEFHADPAASVRQDIKRLSAALATRIRTEIDKDTL